MSRLLQLKPYRRIELNVNSIRPVEIDYSQLYAAAAGMQIGKLPSRASIQLHYCTGYGPSSTRHLVH